MSTGDCFPSAAFEQFFFLLLNALLRKIKRSGNLFFETSEKKKFPSVSPLFFRGRRSECDFPQMLLLCYVYPVFCPYQQLSKVFTPSRKREIFPHSTQFPSSSETKKTEKRNGKLFRSLTGAKEGNLFPPTFFKPTEIVKRLVVGEMDIFSVFFSHLHGATGAPGEKKEKKAAPGFLSSFFFGGNTRVVVCLEMTD